MTADRATIHSGDLLLFSSCTLPSFFTRVGISSNFHHVGIALRMHEGKITLNEGKLYIYDVNNVPRYDELTGKTLYISVVDYDSYENDYNMIAVRHLHRKYHTPDFLFKVREFIHKFSDYSFSHNKLSMIVAWLGLPFGNPKGDKEVICSELVARFYHHCLSLDLQDHHTFNPGHFVGRKWLLPITGDDTPSTIFDGKHVPITINYASWTSLLVPLIAVLVIACIVVYLLYRSR